MSKREKGNSRSFFWYFVIILPLMNRLQLLYVSNTWSPYHSPFHQFINRQNATSTGFSRKESHSWKSICLPNLSKRKLTIFNFLLSQMLVKWFDRKGCTFSKIPYRLIVTTIRVNERQGTLEVLIFVDLPIIEVSLYIPPLLKSPPRLYP